MRKFKVGDRVLIKSKTAGITYPPEVFPLKGIIVCNKVNTYDCIAYGIKHTGISIPASYYPQMQRIHRENHFAESDIQSEQMQLNLFGDNLC